MLAALVSGANDGDVGSAGGLGNTVGNGLVKRFYLDFTRLDGSGHQTGVVGDHFELDLVANVVVGLDVQSVAKGTGALGSSLDVLACDVKVVANGLVVKRVLAFQDQLLSSSNADLKIAIIFFAYL